ncbi:MAG TPA: hypothetical protein VK694_08170 [Verrucomicrobiae bacterium]|nr:hypothetical protein [Verrucomicrobiae bacterium]
MADDTTTEEPKDTPKPGPVRRGVMDIQRPRPQAPLASRPAPASVKVETPAAPADEEPAFIPADEESAPTPVVDTPPPNKRPNIIEQAAAADAKAAADNPAATHDPHQQMLAAHASKKGRPVAVIVVAVLIALVMAGLTAFAYMKTKDSTKTTGDHPSQQSAAPEETHTQGATTADVDSASKEVDSAAAANEAADIPESDLTDQTLGL